MISFVTRPIQLAFSYQILDKLNQVTCIKEGDLIEKMAKMEIQRRLKANMGDQQIYTHIQIEREEEKK